MSCEYIVDCLKGCKICYQDSDTGQDTGMSQVVCQHTSQFDLRHGRITCNIFVSESYTTQYMGVYIIEYQIMKFCIWIESNTVMYKGVSMAVYGL